MISALRLLASACLLAGASFAQSPASASPPDTSVSDPAVVVRAAETSTLDDERGLRAALGVPRAAAGGAVAGGDVDAPPPASPAPEPGSFLLVGTGLIALALSSRRWRRTLANS